MRLTAAALLAPLLLATLACEPPVEPWTEESDLELTAGFRTYDEQSGEVGFLALEAGDPVLMERGFQGGQHIELMLLTDAFDVFADVDYRMEIREPGKEGALLYDLRATAGTFPAEDLGGDAGNVFVTPRLILDDTALIGREVEVRVRLESEDGEVGRVQIRGVVELYDPFPAFG